MKIKNINEIVPTISLLNEEEKQNAKKEWYTILHEMFDWQRMFGDYCFKKNNIKDNDGNILEFNTIFKEFQEKKFGPNDLPNEWIKKFHECMVKELEEIEELLPWKHWSKESIGEKTYKDLTKDERLGMLKIELVDIWHFLMSAMMCVGMGPKELHELYISKNKVNFERQQKEYNTANKNEDDNINITKKIN